MLIQASPAFETRFLPKADREMDATNASQNNQTSTAKSSSIRRGPSIAENAVAEKAVSVRLSQTFGRRPFGRAIGFLAVSAIGTLLVGCGGQAEPTAQTGQSSVAAAAGAEQQPTELEPTEIVSQLLDRVRRGGKDGNSNELLTKLAQQELTRIGRPFEFPGSPDTTYEVRQAFPVPDQQEMVWVQTYLTEPTESGEGIQYEVVWTLRKETVGWRVSGFVIDQGEGLEPLQFDFENGDEMAARLAALEGGQQPVNR